MLSLMDAGTLSDGLQGHHVWDVHWEPGRMSNFRAAVCARCGTRIELYRVWTSDGFTLEDLPPLEGCSA